MDVFFIAKHKSKFWLFRYHISRVLEDFWLQNTLSNKSSSPSHPPSGTTSCSSGTRSCYQSLPGTGFSNQLPYSYGRHDASNAGTNWKYIAPHHLVTWFQGSGFLGFRGRIYSWSWCPRTQFWRRFSTEISSSSALILLMEEILHHLGCTKPVNNGINYLSYQLVQDFFHQQ